MSMGVQESAAETPVRELKKLDQGKVPLDLLPVGPLWDVARVLQFGAKKYAPNAWRGGFEWNRAYGAALRHITQWWGGETKDAETGGNHLAHAICELMFLLEWQEHSGAGEDNRP